MKPQGDGLSAHIELWTGKDFGNENLPEWKCASH